MKYQTNKHRTDGTNGALGNRGVVLDKPHERKSGTASGGIGTIVSPPTHGTSPSRGGPCTKNSPMDANRGKRPPATQRKFGNKGVAPGDDSRQQADPLEECYELIAAHHRVHKLGERLLTPKVRQDTLNHWRSLLEGTTLTWVELMKYKLPAFFAVWFGNKPEESPFNKSDSPYMLLSSRALLREMRKIVRTQSDVAGNKSHHLDSNVSLERRKRNYNNFYSFVVGVNYLKKGLPRPSKDMLDAGIEKTVKTLFQREPPKVIAETGELENMMNERMMRESMIEGFPMQYHKRIFNGRVTRRDLESQIRRTVHELFEGKVFGIDEFGANRLPSLRANLVNSVKDLGTFGLFQTNESLQQFPGLYVGPSTKRIFNNDTGEFQDVEGLSIAQSENHSTNETISCFEEALREDPFCDPVALAEPLKVRIITKEPPYLMQTMRSFQKWMWTVLSKWKIFSLLTKPEVRPETLAFLGFCSPNEKFLSGDYSAATNELRSWATQAVISALRKHVDLDQQTNPFFELVRRSLIGHKYAKPVYDAEGNYVDDSVFDQKNGQMMGSVTSFPILCIINCALCRMTLEFDQGKALSYRGGELKLRDCKMLINGDDCVFAVSDVGYEFWKRVGRVVGLIPSIGKFYYCRYYLNINSTSFYYSPYTFEFYSETSSILPTYDLIEVPWRLQKYVNWGLITGKKRSQEIEQSGRKKPDPVAEFIRARNDETSLSQISFKIVETSPDHIAKAALKQFIDRRIRPNFQEGTIPWFVPERFGGLGICPKFGGLREIEKQRCQWLQGHEELTEKIKRISNFALAPIWSVLADKVRKIAIAVGVTNTDVKEDDGLFSSLSSEFDEAKGQFIALSPYFVSDTELSQDPHKYADKVRAMLSLNRRTWRNLRRVKNLPRYQGFDPWKCAPSHSVMNILPVEGLGLPPEQLNSIVQRAGWKALRGI